MFWKSFFLFEFIHVKLRCVSTEVHSFRYSPELLSGDFLDGEFTETIYPILG